MCPPPQPTILMSVKTVCLLNGKEILIVPGKIIVAQQYKSITGMLINISAVTGNLFFSDKFKMFCKLNCCSEDFLNGLRIVFPEIGDRVMIRSEASK